MKRLLTEPLLHFLLLGAAIFVVYRFLGGSGTSDPQAIVVTPAQIAALAEGFNRVWRRPPTAQELDGLVREHIREEVYYREALALGLDRDDTVVRRRLRQKMEFLSEDTMAPVEPTDAELREILAARPNLFRIDRRYSFTQVYLNPDARPDTLAEDAASVLAELRQAGASADPAAAGDRSLLEHSFNDIPAAEIRKLFGESFEAKLAGIESGEWQGPVESGYGAHLVLIRQRTEGRIPTLEEVREAVRNEWLNARREQARDSLYQSLLERYDVTIEAVPTGQSLPP
jgi:hypothetical protein